MPYLPARATRSSERAEINLNASTATDDVTADRQRRLREALSEFDLESLAGDIVAGALANHYEEHGDDEEFARALTQGVQGNLRYMQAVLVGEASLDDELTDQALTVAALKARIDIPQVNLRRSYHAGTEYVRAAAIDEIRRRVDAGDLSGSETLDALVTLEQLLNRIEDKIVTTVARVHALEEEALRATHEHLRRRVLKDVLQGATTTPVENLTAVLDYDVAAEHVAILLPRLPESDTSRLLAVLADGVEFKGSLVFPLGLSSTVLWLGCPTWQSGWWTRLRQSLTKAEVCASISHTARGVDGFGRTLAQARRIEQLRAQSPGGPEVMFYRDVRLEVLVQGNHRAARDFIVYELGGIANDAERHQTLAHTLDVWLDSGSHVSTAAILGVHEHTVRNRLRRVEELIDHPLTERRTELRVALRLQKAAWLRQSHDEVEDHESHTTEENVDA